VVVRALKVSEMRTLRIRPRSPLVARFVRSVAYNEAALAPALERIMPSAGVDLMLNLDTDEFRTYHGDDLQDVVRVPGAILGGPHTTATVIDTMNMRCVVSVMFRTGTASAAFGLPMSEACDELVPLEAVWGRAGATLRERVLDAPTPDEKLRVVEDVLLEHIDRSEPERAMIRAASALAWGARVADVTDQTGLSSRTFVRTFRKHFGLTPKRFARVQRLQRLLRGVAPDPAVDWARAAVEHGYFDQSHLVNDFRELTGITPTAYEARSPDAHNHVPVAS
jgi:AraC-like DNA-binding protein